MGTGHASGRGGGNKGVSRADLRKGGFFEWVFESTYLGVLEREGAADRALAASAMRSFGHSDVIVEIGRPGEGLHLILYGHVIVQGRAPSGGFSTIAHLGPGHLFGERSILRDEATGARVVASSDVQTLFLPRAAFEALVRAVPSFKRQMEDLVHIRERWNDLLDVISESRFLRPLGREDAERLLQAGRLKHYRAGAKLIEKGSLEQDVHLVVRGRVQVDVPEGGPVEYRSGDLVGQAAIVLGSARTADVVAIDTVETLCVDGKAFVAILDRNPLVQRQILQALVVDGVEVAVPTLTRPAGRLVVFVGGAEQGLGSTTVAYGLAHALTRAVPVAGDPGLPVEMLDLEGEETARELRLEWREGEFEGLPVRRLVAPSDWTFGVTWPARAGDAGALVRAARAKGQGALIVTGRLRDASARAALDNAGMAVFVRKAGEHPVDVATGREQVHFQAVRVAEGVPLPLQTAIRAVRIPTDEEAVTEFRRHKTLDAVGGRLTGLGRACERLARVLRGRSVGVALGGGGAFGFAHVGLLRVLEQNGLPIDYVAGVSFGSVVGAVYCGGGMRAVEELVARRYSLLAACLAAFASTKPIRWFINSLVPGRLETTEVPFYPVGMDLNGRTEYVLPAGDLGLGVLAASSLPGLWPTLELPGLRVIDGGLINNVPASTLWTAGADFIISSNIVPSNPAPRWMRGLTGRAVDAMQGVYNVLAQVGKDRSLLADYPFNSEVEGYDVFQFDKGDRIAACAEAQARTSWSDIATAYRTDRSARLVHPA